MITDRIPGPPAPSRATTTPAVARHLSWHQRQALAGFLFILPTWLFWLIWTGWAAAFSVAVSFTEWRIVDTPRVIGVANYVALAGDDRFLLSLRNTLLYVCVLVPVAIIIALGLALLINETRRWREFFRIAYFLPVVTSMAAVSLLWKWLYQPAVGLINLSLEAMGIPGVNWLGNEHTALLAVAAMMTWKSLGFTIILFLAGMQVIPEHLYEAAVIDGAGRWRRIRHITIPLLGPTTLFVCITSMASGLQLFLPIFLMTGGGPAYSSSVLAYLVWEHAFKFLNAGYASAIASIMFALILTITVVQLKFFARE